MKTYHYFLTFSPYMNTVTARNRKEAWAKIVDMWGAEYDCEKVVTLS